MAFRHVLIALAATPLGALLLAIGLILSQGPEQDPRGTGGHENIHHAAAQVAPRQSFDARDGARLGYLEWGPPDAPILAIALHGSGGHGGWMAGAGAALAERLEAHVVAPDLRGHGPAPQRRGDVDYIGQLEDDIADLIAHLGRDGRQLVLLGHSGGGGLAIRFAGGTHGGILDRAILIAPFLQHDAPTAMPPKPGRWARPLTRRIAGLYMLNLAGITALNHLPVVQFHQPAAIGDDDAAAFATRSYTYRMQFALSPRRDWQADAAALPPFLLIAGSRDQTFNAAAYEPALAPVAPQGRVLVLEGAGHSDILDDERLHEAIAEFLAEDG